MQQRNPLVKKFHEGRTLKSVVMIRSKKNAKNEDTQKVKPTCFLRVSLIVEHLGTGTTVQTSSSLSWHCCWGTCTLTCLATSWHCCLGTVWHCLRSTVLHSCLHKKEYTVHVYGILFSLSKRLCHEMFDCFLLLLLNTFYQSDPRMNVIC